MGYTHYYSASNWTAKDANGYKQALPILEKIAEKYKGIICYECEDVDFPPQVNSAGIHLNGKEEDGHETFSFNPGKPSREFCKTARKPYDLPVCEMLLVLKAYLPNLELSSDGFNGYAKDPKIDGFWGTAINNVKEYGIHYTIKVVSQGPGREKYVNITPVFDKFINAVAAGMKPAKKTKKPSKKELLNIIKELVCGELKRERQQEIIDLVARAEA